MVIEFPSPARRRPGGHAGTDAADLAELLRQLHALGRHGSSLGLRAALAQLGCDSERELLVLLLQRLVDEPAPPQRPPAPVYVPY